MKKTIVVGVVMLVIGFAAGAGSAHPSTTTTPAHAATASTATASAPASVSLATPTPKDNPVTLSGKNKDGQKSDTNSITMSGGEYTVDYSTDVTGIAKQDNCIIHFASDSGANVGVNSYLYNDIPKAGEPESGKLSLHSVKAGSYHFELEGCGAWSLTIAPR
jgi:hypothetical protein